MESEEPEVDLENDPSQTVKWLHSIDHLLGAKWLHRPPPRLTVGTVIEKKFKVSRVLTDARKYQLLEAVSIDKAGCELAADTLYVLKVIRPGQLGKLIAKHELEWIRSFSRGILGEGRSCLLQDFSSQDLHFMVFNKYKFTLKSLLEDHTLSPLSKQHVQEISLQVLNATQFIHKKFTLHGNICPETIEFFSSERSSYSVYNPSTLDFEKKHVLTCTKLQVAYYGDFGIRTICAGTDQYRAPEVVFGFGHRYSGSADLFSIGCVIAELALGDPLFPPCEEGSSLYRVEKALLYHAISGYFTEEMAAKIELNYPSTMDLSEVRPIFYAGVSESVAKMITKPIHFEWLFSQHDVALAGVVSGLVKTYHRNRSNLEDVLKSEFFRKHYNE